MLDLQRGGEKEEGEVCQLIWSKGRRGTCPVLTW